MKVATTRVELHKIQHKSIQVVAEGIGLENYLIRNVAALRNFQYRVCLRKIKKLPLFLLASKTNKPLGDDTFENQSIKLIC